MIDYAKGMREILKVVLLQIAIAMEVGRC